MIHFTKQLILTSIQIVSSCVKDSDFFIGLVPSKRLGVLGVATAQSVAKQQTDYRCRLCNLRGDLLHKD